MLRVQEIEVSIIKPWEDNPRINDQAVHAVARSIQSFGFNVPILCDKELTIIAGHTRWEAAKKLGMRVVPTIVLDMTDTQRRAFAVADNKTAGIAEWDFPKLCEVLEELRCEDIDLTSLGYRAAELQALLVTEEDFDWNEFEDELAREFERTHVLLPVKIRAEDRGKLKTGIKEYAKKHGIEQKDSALTAGYVLAHLLGC